MSQFEDYQNKYKHIVMERREGILQMTLHSDGAPLRWGMPPTRNCRMRFMTSHAITAIDA